LRMKSNWFKHPLGLSDDKRLAQLIQEEGVKGYGTYLYLVEKLSLQEDHHLSFQQLSLFERKGFHHRYMELIVRKYTDLFIVEGEEFRSVIDFGPSCTRSAQSLRTSYAEPKQNMPKRDNNLNDNNVSTSSRTHVREEKKREEKKQQKEDAGVEATNKRFMELLRGVSLQSSWNDNLYRYEQRIDGKRCYMGCPLPDNAPPRPSPRAIWNNLEAYWYEPAG